MKPVVIIGGGVAGLAAAYELGKAGISALILEKQGRVGGLCKSFEMCGEWFDLGGHCTFAKDDYVRGLLEKDIPYFSQFAEAYNYKKGSWIRNPAQVNLVSVDTNEKINIIKSFVGKHEKEGYSNYKEWLYGQYGDYFAENYPMQYTRKYWTVDASELETKWIGPRMYIPTLEKMLYGAFEKDTPCLHYSNGIRYPLEFGYEKFLDNLKKNTKAFCNVNISKIALDEKLVFDENGSSISFEKLVLAAPLPEIIPLIDSEDDEVLKATSLLNHTSMVLVSLYLKKEKDFPPSPAFYVYDEDIWPSRVYSTSKYAGKSEGAISLQAEVYYSRFKPMTLTLQEIKRNVIEQLERIGIVNYEDILETDVRYEKYANIMFTHDIYRNRGIVHDYLDLHEVLYAGRFGEWDYLWSDQAILSGRQAAKKIIENYSM